MAKRLLCLAAAAGFLAAPTAVSKEAPQRPRAIVLITLDTTRADHLGAWGYDRPTASYVDSLAAGGVRFATAVTTMPTTDPAHTSMLTGLHPRSHGIRKNGETLARPEDPNLASWARSLGYRTGAFISRKHLVPAEIDLRGFDHEEGPAGRERDGRDTAARARSWIREQGDQPVFVWLHLFDPHWPYEPPDALAEPFLPENPPHPQRLDNEPARSPYTKEMIDTLTALYDAEIVYTDAIVRGFLEWVKGRLPEGEAPLVILTADHGEAMGELDQKHRFAFDHGKQLFQGIVQVPLLFHWPGRIPAGRVADAPASLVDLPATLFDLLGDDGFPTQGRNLAALWRGEGDRSGFVFSERRELGSAARRKLGSDTQYAVQDGRYKLILSLPGPRAELYDLANDPQETRDLAGDLPEERHRLHAALDHWLRDTPVRDSQVSEVPPAKLDALRALGYIDDAY